MSAENTVVNPVLDYSTKNSTLCQPKWIELPISNIPVASLASQTTGSWVIPPMEIFSLGNSELDFDWTTAASAGDFATCHCDIPPLQGARLVSQSGTLLHDNQRLLEWNKLMQPFTTKMTDFMQKGPITEGNCSGLHRANEAAGASLLSKEVKSDGALQANLYAYQGANHLRSSGADATTIVTNWRIKLKDLPFAGPLSDVRLQFYGGQYATMYFTWAAANRIDFLADDADLANRKVAVATATITNLKFRLCVESDAATRMSVMNQVMAKGISYLTPAIESYDVTLDTGAAQNRQITLSSSNGKSVLAIASATSQPDNNITLLVNVTDQADTASWLTKRLYLNNVPLTNESLTALTYFQSHQDQFRDSLINSASALLRHKVFVESFVSGMTLADLAKINGNVAGGVELSQSPLSVAFQFTKPTNAMYHWLFVLLTRYLTLSPSGPIVSNLPVA